MKFNDKNGSKSVSLFYSEQKKSNCENRNDVPKRREAGANRAAPEAGFGELQVAPPVVPQRVGGGCGSRRDGGGGGSRSCVSDGGRRRGGGRGRRSEGSDGAGGGTVDGVGE